MRKSIIKIGFMSRFACAPTSALKDVVVASVTTVVSLTLMRARQGERLAFAFANALAKRDIGNRMSGSALMRIYAPFRSLMR